MKSLFLLLLIVTNSVSAQTQKKVTAGASVIVNLGAKGFRINDAGIGAEVHGNLFANRNWQLRTEAGINHFIGDKLANIGSYGNVYGFNPTVLSAWAGPEYFAPKFLSVAAMYGISHYKNDVQEITSGGVRLALTGHVGKARRLLTGFTYTALLKDEFKAHYFGLSLGYRFL